MFSDSFLGRNKMYREVVKPYLIGEDANRNPDCLELSAQKGPTLSA